jgi:hypothetical protein
MADAFKMLYVERPIRREARKFLLFCGADAALPFQRAGWQAQALRSFQIDSSWSSCPRRFAIELPAPKRGSAASHDGQEVELANRRTRHSAKTSRQPQSCIHCNYAEFPRESSAMQIATESSTRAS